MKKKILQTTNNLLLITACDESDTFGRVSHPVRFSSSSFFPLSEMKESLSICNQPARKHFLINISAIGWTSSSSPFIIVNIILFHPPTYSAVFHLFGSLNMTSTNFYVAIRQYTLKPLLLLFPLRWILWRLIVFLLYLVEKDVLLICDSHHFHAHNNLFKWKDARLW